MSLTGKISSTIAKALTKKGRKTKSENAAISKAAKANNMPVSEFKKEAKNLSYVYSLYEDKFSSYLDELVDKLI